MNWFIRKTAAMLSFLLCIVSLFYFAPNVAAQVSTEYFTDDILASYTVASADSTVLEINAKSVVLMEPYTGRILYESNSNEQLAPASITKIMSLLLVMDAIENEKITLQTKVTASEHAASMGGSQIWLKENEVMTVDELLRASVIASANDATVALAELVAGSEETFVEEMNARAKELGMKNTVFVNACGLDAEGHLTTAMDVAIMSAALIKHDLIKKYSTVWMDALRDGKSELVNTNKLVRYYNGCTGLKTGTTSKAGCCVCATAERNGMELIAVVMGGATSNDRFSGAKKLLDYGFANWTFENITADVSDLGTLQIEKGVKKSITPEATGSVDLLIKKGLMDKIEKQAVLNKTIMAPIKSGDVIGKVRLMLEGEQLGEIPITSADTVEKISFFNSFLSLLKATLCT